MASMPYPKLSSQKKSTDKHSKKKANIQISKLKSRINFKPSNDSNKTRKSCSAISMSTRLHILSLSPKKEGSITESKYNGMNYLTMN